MPIAPGNSRNSENPQPKAAAHPPAIDWANVASEVRIMRQLDKVPGQHHQGQESQGPTGSRSPAAVMH